LKVDRYAKDLYKKLDNFSNGNVNYDDDGYALTKCFDKVVYTNPYYAAAWHNKVVALDKLGRDEDAKKSYDKSKDI
jgi:Flp pilus assembly protein TadD